MIIRKRDLKLAKMDIKLEVKMDIPVKNPPVELDEIQIKMREWLAVKKRKITEDGKCLLLGSGEFAFAAWDELTQLHEDDELPGFTDEPEEAQTSSSKRSKSSVKKEAISAENQIMIALVKQLGKDYDSITAAFNGTKRREQVVRKIKTIKEGMKKRPEQWDEEFITLVQGQAIKQNSRLMQRRTPVETADRRTIITIIKEYGKDYEKLIAAFGGTKTKKNISKQIGRIKRAMELHPDYMD